MTTADPPARTSASDTSESGADITSSDTINPRPVGELTYADAVHELEAILDALETDELDVDHLAERVARAAELIRECRRRIDATRFAVERIVHDLRPDDASSDDPPGGGRSGAGG